ncbi:MULTISPECIES: type II toxin-antitoxin system RelB/DinJ family antitoxin [unclassified Adlercreutzia]|uniref:type II toxin-antitoxin system RelB/DinJ family antitoxin n=1 Tax=unclassified Adlercreutzia TaxID=2636013 RepID=UPI0013EB2C5A|nr:MULTISPECIES: type II toxin-antitoxin system RelB/DinJ family antitoxin [unclassified Adlercreutzia]
MSAPSVTVRVDEATKLAAASIVEDFGFDLSSVTRAFYRQIVREQRIPLNLEYPKPNNESREAIEEAKAIIASGDPGYDSVDAMFEAMGV